MEKYNYTTPIECFTYTNLPEWQKEIIFKYPSIYLDPNEEIVDWIKNSNGLDISKRSNFCNLRYGFECGEGWKELIDSFSLDTVKFVKRVKQIDSTSFVKSFIFKQKMGRLTWQGTQRLSPEFDNIYYGYIQSISNRSLFISELSGESGSLKSDNGYLQVMTEQEFKNIKEKNKRGGTTTL